MNEGDVILTSIRQADGVSKNRPAVVLRIMPGFGDRLVCGVSTQLRHEVKGFDDLLDESSSDFAPSGLQRASIIRLGFLAVLPSSDIIGKIGSIDTERHQRLLERLASFLTER
jgi:mRNA interferase MazF